MDGTVLANGRPGGSQLCGHAGWWGGRVTAAAAYWRLSRLVPVHAADAARPATCLHHGAPPDMQVGDHPSNDLHLRLVYEYPRLGCVCHCMIAVL